MKKLLLAVLISLCFTVSAFSEETYKCVEFSPLKLKAKKSIYVFKANNTFTNEVNNDNTINYFDGEYEMYTALDGAGYIYLKDGAIMIWFMKDEDVLLGWKAEIKNKYEFDFFIIFGNKIN